VKLDVLVAGEIYVDLIFGGFDFWPKPGQEAFARDYRSEIGGGAAITACGLATLGATTGIFAISGCDHYDWIAAHLAEKGVRTELLTAKPDEPTGVTVAITGPGDRAFFTHAGANRHFADTATAMPFAAARHIHLAWAPPWDLAPTLFDAIHRAGATVSLDAGWHESWLANPRALGILSAVDVFFPNEAEAARLTGKTEPGHMLHRFRDAGIRCVALKLGAAGASLLAEDRFCHAPAPAVAPLDPTGAGDCFDAGFLYAWLRGQSPERCLALANLCGALSTQAYGGIAGFPSRETVATKFDL
jgi:ribokinase